MNSIIINPSILTITQFGRIYCVELCGLVVRCRLGRQPPSRQVTGQLSIKKKSPVRDSLCGAGRARTAVQTGDKPAFYMLIRWLVVGVAPDIGTQGHP